GATASCLVCEDLARVEPVQPVLREMGPSLLFALLMDGPQYEARWAAKSATVFADDPGSSVLILTSLALVRRSIKLRFKHSKPAMVPIALWHEPGKGAREIPLAPDAHAVHFTLQTRNVREVTLDGRDDRRTAEEFRLSRPHSEKAFLQVKD